MSTARTVVKEVVLSTLLLLSIAPVAICVPNTQLGADAQIAATANSSLTVLKGTHSFDGRTKYIKIPNQSFLNFGTNNFSFSAWVKTASRNGIEVIFDKRIETSGPVQGYHVATWDGKLLIQLADGNGWTNYISSIFIADAQWHHIAITVDRQKPDGIRYYLDGNEASEPANPMGRRGSLSTSSPLVIGKRSDYPSQPGYFTGSMADIKLFRSILTPQQIEKLATEKRS
jgi:Concanavalin A-like lectin/glucanases superfamily